MAQKLGNYALGKWIEGTDDGELLVDASTGAPIALASSKGLDFGDMMRYARQTGGPVLSRMTFHERGRMIKALALYLIERKDKYYTISYQTGATKVDSWIDIEGGIGNLFAYSSLRRQFPDQPYSIDGDHAPLSKGGSFIGHHIMVPKRGVAIHINAFNFPIWGMLEKIAVNLMAGVPAIVKPATLTSYLTEAMVRDIDASGILPPGSLQLICGSARGILDHVESQDVVTFTGSASTGRMLKSNPRLIEESVPFNMEADSLNCIILGEDAVPGTPEFDIFIKEVRKEMTVKCGQKCTAIRRVIVPENLVEDVQIQLGKALSKTAIGDPRVEGVRMAPWPAAHSSKRCGRRSPSWPPMPPSPGATPTRWRSSGETRRRGPSWRRSCSSSPSRSNTRRPTISKPLDRSVPSCLTTTWTRPSNWPAWAKGPWSVPS